MGLLGWEKVSRSDDDYKACVVAVSAGGTIAGLVVGSAGAPLTAGASVPVVGAAGAALGFVVGYLACPYLAPRVRDKLTGGVSLSQNEVQDAAEAMAQYANIKDAKTALRLLASVRRDAVTTNANWKCLDPASQARKITAA